MATEQQPLHELDGVRHRLLVLELHKPIALVVACPGVIRNKDFREGTSLRGREREGGERDRERETKREREGGEREREIKREQSKKYP